MCWAGNEKELQPREALTGEFPCLHSTAVVLGGASKAMGHIAQKSIPETCIYHVVHNSVQGSEIIILELIGEKINQDILDVDRI